MATTGKKKVRGLWKRKVKFIRDRLHGLDLEIMTAFVVSEVEAVEYHVAHYPERQALWTHLKSSKKQEKLMKFLRGTFFMTTAPVPTFWLPSCCMVLRNRCSSSLCKYVDTSIMDIADV